MYHREGKKCDEKESERGGAERAELPRARKEREIIGSCEYLIGDHLYLYLYVYTRESSILITPPQKKKREESKNLNKIRHTHSKNRKANLSLLYHRAVVFGYFCSPRAPPDTQRFEKMTTTMTTTTTSAHRPRVRSDKMMLSSRRLLVFFFLCVVLVVAGIPSADAKKKKNRREERFEEEEEESGGAGGEPTAMDASNLLASVSNQGLLSRSSGKADDYTEVGETPENVLTPEDEFLMQDDGTNGDSPKTTSVLAGDLSMDTGTAGSIGGIPDDVKKENEEEETIEEMFDEEYDGSHRMHVRGHAGAFVIALVVCVAFVNWAFGSFFVVKTNKEGWANLPSVELSRDAKVLFNSVDKYDKV